MIRPSSSKSSPVTALSTASLLPASSQAASSSTHASSHAAWRISPLVAFASRIDFTICFFSAFCWRHDSISSMATRTMA